MIFLILIILFANDFKFEKFPLIYDNKKIIFINTSLNINSSITYNLAKINPIWCSEDLELNKPKLDIYLNCYGLTNKELIEAQYIKPNKKVIDKVILDTKINPFKLYYYIKMNYFRDNICLTKEDGKYFIYSYSNRENLNIIINQSISEFNNLDNDKLIKVYMFFISSFNTACLRYLFYYQASTYGFYDVDILFNQKNWLK